MPFLVTSLGVPQVVLRKVDGARDPASRRPARRDVHVRRTCRHRLGPGCRSRLGRRDPRPRDRVRIVVAGAPPPTRTIVRVQEELGWEFIQIYGLTETSPLLTINRTRTEWDDLDAEERASRLVRAGAPAIGVQLSLDRGRGAGALQRVSRRLLGQPAGVRPVPGRRLVPHRGRRRDRHRRLPHDPRPQEGRDHHRRRERLLDRGRGRDLLPPRRRRGRRHRRTRREVGRDDQGPRGQGRGLRRSPSRS